MKHKPSMLQIFPWRSFTALIIMMGLGLLLSGLTAQAKSADKPNHSSQTPIPTALKEAIDARFLQIEPQGSEGSRYHALNLKQGMRLQFTTEGVEVQPQKKPEHPWRWGMTLAGYGFEGFIKPVKEGPMRSEGSRMIYDRGDLREWYVNEGRGVEQGFTLSQPPLVGSEAPSTTLVLAFDLSGDLSPRWEEEGKSILFVDKEKQTVLRYDHLVAFDATGRKLKAQLALEAGQVRIIVEADKAHYPIVVDPLIAIPEGKLPVLNGSRDDWFGFSVSVSGDTALIGAVFDDDACPGDINCNSGSAYVFVRSGTTWSQQAKLIPEAGYGYSAGDLFGHSVSVSGDTALIGAGGDDDKGFFSGSAYVFVRWNGAWTQQAKLIPDPGYGHSASDLFGFSVSVSSDTALIGAIGDDDACPVDPDCDSGSAYVFVRSAGTWTEELKLTAFDGAPFDGFGESVSLSGKIAVIGAFGDDDACPEDIHCNSGSAYPYRLVQSCRSVKSDGCQNDRFPSLRPPGDSFAPPNRGDRMRRTRSGTPPVANDQYVTTLENTAVEISLTGSDADGDRLSFSLEDPPMYGSLSTEAKRVLSIFNPDPETGEQFGDAVAALGDNILVGTYLDTINGVAAGAAYVMDGNTGNVIHKIPNPEPQEQDWFGFSVAEANGKVFVGAPRDTVAGFNKAGSAYLFDAATGELLLTIPNPDPAINDQFGKAVASIGRTLLVSAQFDFVDGLGGAGAVYLFNERTGKQIGRIPNPYPASSDSFGSSLAAVDGNILVSAPLDSPPGAPLNTGSVYLFNLKGKLLLEIPNPDPNSDDQFGGSVAALDGNFIVGAYLNDVMGYEDAGSAYLFDGKTGQLLLTLDNPEPAVNTPGDWFGRSVAGVHGRIVVGAQYDDHPDGENGTGTVYVFNGRNGNLLSIIRKPYPLSGNRFGHAVAGLQGNILVGMPFETQGGYGEGAVYLFDGRLNKLIYTPDLNYFGPDDFIFTAHDGTQFSAPATVSIDVVLQIP